MAEPALIHTTQKEPDSSVPSRQALVAGQGETGAGMHAPMPSHQLLEGPAGTPMSYWQLVWWRLRRDRVTLTAAAVILCIVLSALLAPYLAPHNPFQGSIRKRLAPIGTPGYILGTDEQGRDMLSRLLYGGRPSLRAG